MLKFLPLFFASLRRKPMRTGLTIASIVVAFLLFGLLKTMQGALAMGADLAGIDRLATMHKVSLIQQFPLSYLNRIRGVDGVVAATSFNWFGGIYQDERNQLSAMATEPASFVDVYPEYAMPPEQRADWIADRASMIVGKTVAERFGWKVGDTFPCARLLSQGRWRRHLGFAARRDLRLVERRQLEHLSSLRLFERVAGPEWRARLDRLGDPQDRGPRRRRRKSRLASTRCLRTRRPRRRRRPSARSSRASRTRWATSATIVTAVATAVFFTMLLVTGNTMAQSVRERINEIAVLEDARLFEAHRRGPRADRVVRDHGARRRDRARRSQRSWPIRCGDLLAQFFPVIGIPSSTYVMGAVLIVVLSVLAALLPSLEAWRLKITDALRKV